jgi:MFS family permease
MFVNALAPFVSLDAETYHHVFIRNFITSGHIGVIPGDPYSYYPLSLEVLTSTAFTIGGPEASNLCLLFMQLLLVGWIIDWLAQAGRPREGYLLATMVCGLAFWPELTYSGFVDIGVATFAIAGAITFFDWLRNRSLKGSHLTILLAGLFAGAAAASKHSALPLAALIFVHLIWLVMADRVNRRSAVLAFLGFALMFLIPVAPWYVRNLIITGNPVFPFLRSIFGGPESLLGDDISTWSSWGLPITLKNYIIYPLKLAWFYSVDYIPFIRFPYVYMTWLFALVPISGILLLHRRISRIVAIWCFVFFNCAFFMMNLQTRYFVPFTILALSLVAGWIETFVSATPAPELGNSLSPRERVGVRATSASWIIFAIALVPFLVQMDLVRTHFVERLPFLSGKMDRHEFSLHVWPSVAVFDKANAVASEDQQICIFSLRTYRLNVPFIHPPSEVFDPSRSPEDMLTSLEGYDVGFIMFETRVRRAGALFDWIIRNAENPGGRSIFDEEEFLNAVGRMDVPRSVARELMRQQGGRREESSDGKWAWVIDMNRFDKPALRGILKFLAGVVPLKEEGRLQTEESTKEWELYRIVR